MTVTEQTWTPEYYRWRHGGWYVGNISYPGGAVGCVSRNYPDHKWRIVCARHSDTTYSSRDAAALAEKKLADAELAAAGDCGECGAHIAPYKGFPWHWDGEACKYARRETV